MKRIGTEISYSGLDKSVTPTFEAYELMEAAGRVGANHAWDYGSIRANLVISKDQTVPIRTGHRCFEARGCLRTARCPVHRRWIRSNSTVGLDLNYNNRAARFCDGISWLTPKKTLDGTRECSSASTKEFQQFPPANFPRRPAKHCSFLLQRTRLSRIHTPDSSVSVRVHPGTGFSTDL